MTYYKGNALYEKLKEVGKTNYRTVPGNAWQLVYGNNVCIPKLLVYAIAVNRDAYKNELMKEDKETIALLNYVALKSKLPLIVIKFISDLQKISEVLYSKENFSFRSITLKELSVIYSSYSLPVSNTDTDKYLNDKSSSAYHNWQRESLGKDLTVSDIDLMKVNEKGQVSVIYELKRSYYELERWAPFKDDYNNFKLISNLCNRCSIAFKIIYNKRTKIPFCDDISKLKIFRIDFRLPTPIKDEGIIILDNFLRQ